jgi:hypothetical protein
VPVVGQLKLKPGNGTNLKYKPHMYYNNLIC